MERIVRVGVVLAVLMVLAGGPRAEGTMYKRKALIGIYDS